MNLVAVNLGDSKAVINQYAAEGKFAFPMVMGDNTPNGIFKRYGVQAYPTNYVIDSRGIVVWRSVGFDEAGMRAALAKLGIK